MKISYWIAIAEIASWSLKDYKPCKSHQVYEGFRMNLIKSRKTLIFMSFSTDCYNRTIGRSPNPSNRDFIGYYTIILILAKNPTQIIENYWCAKNDTFPKCEPKYIGSGLQRFGNTWAQSYKTFRRLFRHLTLLIWLS